MSSKFGVGNKGHVSRRSFLKCFAAGTAMAASPAAFGLTTTAAGAGTSSSLNGAISDSLKNVLSPMGVGTSVHDGWSIVDMGMQARAIVVSLKHPDHGTMRLDICRRHTESVAGLAHTAHFELIWMNEGAGQSVTPPHAERVARVIAELLRRREVMLPLGASELSTHVERVALFESSKLHFGRHSLPKA